MNILYICGITWKLLVKIMIGRTKGTCIDDSVHLSIDFVNINMRCVL